MPMPRVCPTGVTLMETRLGAVTVRLVDPETPPREAVIVVEPAATPVAIPDAPMVAVFVEEELQLTSAVRSALLPSV